jgi:hypothetical protein
MLIVSNGLAGIWALLAHRNSRYDNRALWRFTVLAQFWVFVQIVLGAVQMRTSGVVLAAMSVGIIYSYRSQMRQQANLLYGFGGLFIMGLGIRAAFITT